MLSWGLWIMNAIRIHIKETLDETSVHGLKNELMHLPHISHVEMSPQYPHDVAIEFEENFNVPMQVLNYLGAHGLHTDILPC